VVTVTLSYGPILKGSLRIYEGGKRDEDSYRNPITCWEVLGDSDAARPRVRVWLRRKLTDNLMADYDYAPEGL
jgi:hypothetical protein